MKSQELRQSIAVKLSSLNAEDREGTTLLKAIQTLLSLSRTGATDRAMEALGELERQAGTGRTNRLDKQFETRG